MYAHHRCAHSHSSNLCLELALKLAGKMRDIGGGSAHVEADHFLDPSDGRRACHSNNSTRRATQDRILARKGMGIGQAPRRLHEEQIDARHLQRYPRYVAAQDR